MLRDIQRIRLQVGTLHKKVDKNIEWKGYTGNMYLEGCYVTHLPFE